MRIIINAILFVILFGLSSLSAQTKVVFQEKNGIVAFEAEHFTEQNKDEIRKWYVQHEFLTPKVAPDHDQNHFKDASGETYIEILPDTRVADTDNLITGVNFSDSPGALGIISYWINFETTGRYYVWVRLYSTGNDDNGVHVGIDDSWPSSGKKMQWCDGKNQWTWGSHQRTEANHCGEPYLIYLDVATAGLHKISFSMREDGVEMDKIILTKDKFYVPSGKGPAHVIIIGGDNTPPKAVENLTLHFLDDTSLKISWSPVTDPESSIHRYSIYRNNVLIKSLPPQTTEYIDLNLDSNTEYTYSVTAVNIWNYESQFTSKKIKTDIDKVPPTLMSLIPTYSGDILLIFSEPMDKSSVEELSNYNSSNSEIKIIKAELLNNNTQVFLDVIGHIDNHNYVLSIKNIKDANGVTNPITINQNYKFSKVIWLGEEHGEHNGGSYREWKSEAFDFKATIFPFSYSSLLYKVGLPEAGLWYLWVRMFYGGVHVDAPNSFALSVNDGQIKIIGNKKSSFKKWHWDGDGTNTTNTHKPLLLGSLNAGQNKLEFKVNGIAAITLYFDGIFLTKNPELTPTDFHTLTDIEINPINSIPNEYALNVYPNPFNPSLKISLTGSLTKEYNISIYNQLGQLVDVIKDIKTKVIYWQPKNIPSGTYFIRAELGSLQLVNKVIYLK